MRVLVTGVGGFIASHIARQLHKDGHEVFGVDDFSNGKRSNVPEGIALIEGDLSNKKTINAIPGGCTYILHLAGQSSGEISFDNPVEDLKKNAISTLNLIEYGIRHDVRKLVYASSMSVYGAVEDKPISEVHQCHPLSCYGVGKLAAERYLEIYADKLPYVSLRMFNVYGPGQDMDNMRQGMVSIFLGQALKSNRVHVKGSMNRFRDFIYIDDVVDAWIQITFSENILNEAYNIGTGKRTTIEQLLQALKVHIPDMAWYSEGSTPGDQEGIFSDNSRIKHIIDSFTPLEDGIGEFVSWARTVI